MFSFHPLLCSIFYALAFIGDELLTTGTAALASDDLDTLTLTADRSPASRAKMLMGVCWVSEGLADAGTQHGETAQGHSMQWRVLRVSLSEQDAWGVSIIDCKV